jgi:hypothetical protein
MAINHPAFVVQTDGRVLVCDGATEATCSLAEFTEIEAGFALPDGFAGINVERRGEHVMAVATLADGVVIAIPAEEIRAYDALIAKAPQYAAAMAERAHPLYGVTALNEARQKVSEAISAEAERRLPSTVPGYGPAERDTWLPQLTEARAVLADPSAPAPLLDGILLPGEDRAVLAAGIIAKAEAYAAAVAPVLAAKRKHLAAIWAADLPTLTAYDVAAGWPQ